MPIYRPALRPRSMPWPRLLVRLFAALGISFLVACGSSAPTQTLVEYRRTGGFVGLDDRLLITPSGEFTLTRKAVTKTGVLDAAQLAEIERQLDTVGFQSLNAEYRAPGADLITYTFTYKGKKVSAMDTAVPDQLLPTVEFFNQLIADNA